MLPSLRRLPAAVGATRMTALRASAVGFHCGVAARGPIVVPSMGDSIREGSVVQVLKAVGEAVKVDDIVCVIETDKVAVEVRAQEAGVVTGIAVNAGETVAVGATLLTVDAGAAPSAAPSAPSAAAPPPPVSAPGAAAAGGVTAAAAAAAAATAAHAAMRVPSIKFRYGRRDDAPPAPVTPTPPARPSPPPKPAAVVPVVASFPPSTATRSYLDLPPAYGRPVLSAAEARAIESGGAY